MIIFRTKEDFRRFIYLHDRFTKIAEEADLALQEKNNLEADALMAMANGLSEAKRRCYTVDERGHYDGKDG